MRSAVSRAVRPFVIPRLPMTADCNRFREKTRGLSGRSVQQDAGDDATHGFAQLEISVARGTASRLERVELFQKPNEAPFLRPRRASPQKCLNNQGVVSNRCADRTGGGMTGAPPFWGLSIRCVDRHQFVTRPMKGNRDSRHFGTATQTPPFRQRGRPLSGSHGGLQQADPPGMCGTVPRRRSSVRHEGAIGGIQPSRLVLDGQLRYCPTRLGIGWKGAAKFRQMPMAGCHEQGSLNCTRRRSIHRGLWATAGSYGEINGRAVRR